MHTRISALIVAFLAVGTVLGLLWNKGWFEPYVYTPPIIEELSLVATTSEQVIVEHPLIVVQSPQANATIPKDFSISGRARGPWYFEATFPIQLRDMQGNLIVQTVAQAQGDWMTTEFVPFSAAFTLATDAPTFSGPALLVFMKDNPSGLPENEDSITINVTIQ